MTAERTSEERKLRFYDLANERVNVAELMEWVIETHPDLTLSNMKLPVKAYQIVDHGQTPESVIGFVSTKDYKASVNSFRLSIFQSKRQWSAWQTGVGGVFYENEVPKYFVPMIDLEITSTDDIEADIKKLIPHLNALGIDGSIVKSGDSKIGGYFFIGHEPQDYDPNYWQFMGRVLVSFSEGDSSDAQAARTLGTKLSDTQTIEDAIDIASKILIIFPSIRTGQEREGLLCDPRWIGHQLIQGFTILRYTPGKNYEEKPLQIATYY
jgi:hypothetical protein